MPGLGAPEVGRPGNRGEDGAPGSNGEAGRGGAVGDAGNNGRDGYPVSCRVNTVEYMYTRSCEDNREAII